MSRKAIPPTTCDYMIRMHQKSIASISKYMAGGCKAEGLGDSMFVCVDMITLRNKLDDWIKEYSK